MLLTDYIATMTSIISLLAHLQPDPDMALQVFPSYMSSVYQNVLPIYPLIAADDLNGLICRHVDEASEHSTTIVSQDFDIAFAGTVLRLGHRLFEWSPDATQLREEGNSNIDQFEQCNWRQYASSNQAPTEVAWLVESASFTFLYHFCSGQPTISARVAVTRACERLARNRGPQEWDQPEAFGELVKLAAAWLMLFETLPLVSTSYSPEMPAISFLPRLNLPQLFQQLRQGMRDDLASAFIRRLQSCLAQHAMWQSQKSGEGLEMPPRFVAERAGSVSDIFAYYPWYLAYVELTRKYLSDNANAKYYARSFVYEVIDHIFQLQKNENIFRRTLSLQREIGFIQIMAQGAQLRLCEFEYAIAAQRELLRFMETYMSVCLGKGQMDEYRAQLSSLMRMKTIVLNKDEIC